MTEQNKIINLNELRIDENKKKTKKKNPLRTWLIVALITIGTFFVARFFKPISVKTSTIASLDAIQANTILTASGYIVARSKAEISPKSLGRIAWLNLEEGQKVKKGELVARLEDKELQAQKIELLSSLNQAKRDVVRFKNLYDQKSVSLQVYENSQTQVDVFNAKLNFIEEQIKNTQIFSPIDGMVTVKKAFLGETVAPQGFGGSGSAGATFAVIVDMSTLEMEADISEANLSRIKNEQGALVILDAYPQVQFKAILRQIVPTADRQKGTVKVKVELIDKDPRILPEMSAKVIFLKENSDDQESIVAISSNSIHEFDSQKGAFFIKNNVAQFRQLQLGESFGPWTIVLDGAKPDEVVVLEPSKNTQNWKNKQRVRIVP